MDPGAQTHRRGAHVHAARTYRRLELGVLRENSHPMIGECEVCRKSVSLSPVRALGSRPGPSPAGPRPGPGARAPPLLDLLLGWHPTVSTR